jgi:hypothetical protein
VFALTFAALSAIPFAFGTQDAWLSRLLRFFLPFEKMPKPTPAQQTVNLEK